MNEKKCLRGKRFCELKKEYCSQKIGLLTAIINNILEGTFFMSIVSELQDQIDTAVTEIHTGMAEVVTALGPVDQKLEVIITALKQAIADDDTSKLKNILTNAQGVKTDIQTAKDAISAISTKEDQATASSEPSEPTPA